MPGPHGTGPEPVGDRVEEQSLQLAAVDRELRDGEAGIEPAGLAKDVAPVRRLVDQLARADADHVELIEESEAGEMPDRVRQDVDADAQLAHLAGALVDRRREALLVQRECEREPADAAADDRDVQTVRHAATPLAPQVSRERGGDEPDGSVLRPDRSSLKYWRV